MTCTSTGYRYQSGMQHSKISTRSIIHLAYFVSKLNVDEIRLCSEQSCSKYVVARMNGIHYCGATYRC